MGLLFQFLNLLQGKGPQKWVFDELANIAKMRFKFAEEEDACEYALRLAADAPYYAPEHLLNGHYLYDQWDPDLVRLHLGVLLPACAVLAGVACLSEQALACCLVAVLHCSVLRCPVCTSCVQQQETTMLWGARPTSCWCGSLCA